MIKTRPSLGKTKILITIIVIVLVLVLLNIFQKEVKSFFYSFSAPIQKVFWQAGEGTSSFLSGIFNAGNLTNKVNQLESENYSLLAKLVILSNLQKENESLRQVLELGLNKEFKLSWANIIGKDISQDFVLLDKGSENNLFKDMPVITEENVLVGIISEVYNNFSKVKLISNKDSTFNVLVQKEEDVSGMIKGKGNSEILLDLVTNEKYISSGDIVVTSYLGGIVPANLLIGRITTVYRKDVQSFQKADVEPFFNISKTKVLFIILEF